MKGKVWVSSALRFPRLAIFVFCAIFLGSFRSAERPVNAQANDLAPEAVTQSETFDAVTPTVGIVYNFSNTGAITIPDSGAGSPYPSTITVSNIPIQLAKVTVKLTGMTHTFPSDIDILLVGPQGQTAVIMSDVGGADDINGVVLTLDDDAATPIPAAAITTGTYQPTNALTGDTFPPPAPANPGSSSALSVFQNTNPNGDWKLFLVDDAGVDQGTISGGWTLTLTSAISGQNTNAITVPDSGMANPYPSDITITNHNDRVSRVLVTLSNFSHTSPDDVDILLVSPSGRAVVLMSDAGGSNAVSNLNISLDDTAGALPDTGALTSGTFRPSDYEPGDTFPAPAPSGITMGRTLASLNGTVANGVWKLFVVDDAGNNAGNITGGWNILIGTQSGAIAIEGPGAANPYPSEFTVSGLPGSITRATVTIANFSHLAADDVDILLVSPSGRRIVLISDAGGTTEVGGVNLIFDDAAASAVPDDGPLTSGTYRPADYEPGEVFPAPAPPGAPTGNTLNAFYGSAPNGIWQLYVLNENGSTYGSIAGGSINNAPVLWKVTLQTSTSACLLTISPSVQAFPIAGGSGSFGITQPNGCAWTAASQDSFISLTSSSTGGGNGSIGFTVAPNQGSPRTGTINVTNGVATRSFQVQQPSGCPFSAAQSTVNFTAAGGTGNVNISAGGGCSWQGSTTAPWIQITSPPRSGDGTLAFTVQPNTARTARSATINVGVVTLTVNQAAVRSIPFDFDGDLRADISIYRPSTGTWWIAKSTGGISAQQFGITTDKIVPADFDGDLKADLAVYRDGTWYVVRSSNGTVGIISWGTTGDIPLPGDYNGDGSAEPAVFRPSSGTWWILNSNGTYSSLAFGLTGDIPVPGDYDGDGKTDLSVYRGATTAGASGTWWILHSGSNSASSHAFGTQGDVPVPADYDGDGRDNVAVFRPSTGYANRSLNPATN